MNNDFRIGILCSATEDWIGGLYYSLNIVNQFNYLSEHERPSIILLHSNENNLLLKSYENNEFVSKHAIQRTFGEKVISHLSNKYYYKELKSCIANNKIDALYPVADPKMGDSFNGAKCIYWIPDFQHLYYPEFFSKQEVERRQKVFSNIAKVTSRLVLSSNDALKDFVTNYQQHKISPHAVNFTSCIKEEHYSADYKQILDKYKLPQRFVLIPNQFWKHKNHITAFKALKILKQKNIDILFVCTGSRNDNRNINFFNQLQYYIDQNNLSENIRILGLIPREEQIQIMRCATAIVQPSLFEGWSAVVEDAKSLGKTIFLSDLDIHKEQEPKNAIFFVRDSEVDLADKIAEKWADLKTCPDFEEEGNAIIEMRNRAICNARSFLEVVKGTTI